MDRPRMTRSMSTDPGANKVRWIGALALAALAYWSWTHRKPTFTQRAETAAKASGVSEVSFDPARQRGQMTVICGNADGKLVVYREPGGFSRDDGSLAFITLYRDGCGPKR